jgi:xylan 1,4-beta-xylosidase
MFMKFIQLLFILLLIYKCNLFGQSVSFKTYVNPIIPGDHPDPTLTKVGNDFYTSGSSFNPTPKIYHSTDLVHWEVVAQPVKASWVVYGDEPGGGIWGGHMVFYNNSYWDFFGRGGGSMYFVKADKPEGPWSDPTQVNVPAGVPGLGVDNSIFIDDDNKWYLLTKAGQPNNYIVELGEDGQPTGVVLDLTWLNPNSEGNPYGWAEGPVMWKHDGYYYYSFAQHLYGAQYVMRSDTFTDDKSAWTIIGNNIFTGPTGTYNRPNHISPVVMLDDGTSWTIAHSYHSGDNWYAQGRQGLLCQVTYNDQDFPVIQFPSNNAVPAPDLPSSGIPWMVPKSDMFNSSDLNPEWSFLGYTSEATHSLDVQGGWLYLEPYGGSNTVLQNDGEHNYSLITKVDFEPTIVSDEAGLWIINGPETLNAKVFSTVNGQGEKVLAFSFDNTYYEVENTIGTIVWLKLVRSEHIMLGFYSSDGVMWTQIGEQINAAALDIQQTDYNNFTGNQQGLYVKGKPAFFDLYIYRDAYSSISAQNPANRYGVSPASSYLGGIDNNDWAMYAGVEFGGNDYQRTPLSVEISASSATTGGIVEVWLDSIDTGRKIAECNIDTTGSWTNYQIFKADVDSVSNSHDVYLKFLGTDTQQLFRLNWFRFLSELDTVTSIDNRPYEQGTIQRFQLFQNYPNPFNPTTHISYSVPRNSFITLKAYNLLGQEIRTLFEGIRQPGNYTATFNGKGISSGVYLCTMKAENFVETKKLILLK